MKALDLARIPAVTIGPSEPVMSGIRLMKDERVGVVFVVDQTHLVGALSERDVMFRVVLRGRDAETTPVRDAMTAPAVSLSADATVTEALRLMATHRVRHLPIVGRDSVKGMVSLRHMLRKQTTELTEELEAFLEYCAAGPVES